MIWLSSIKARDFETKISRFITSSRNTREVFIQSVDYRASGVALVQDVGQYNMMIGFIGYKLLKTRDNIWNRCNEIMGKYMMEFYSDKNFFNKTSKVIESFEQKKGSDETDMNLLKFMRNLYSKRVLSSETYKIENIMRMYENRIFNMLSCYPTLNISNRYLNNIVNNERDKKTTVELNDLDYIELLHRIDDIAIRHRVEATYLSRTRICLIDLARLVILRHEYALKNGFTTYYQYINREKYDNTLTIKEMLCTLNKKISGRLEKEVDRIHSYYCDKNNTNILLTNCDIVKYAKNQGMTFKFKLTDSIRCIFDVCKKYFNMTFIKESINGELSDTDLYICYDQNKKILGRLFCDLIWRPDKNVNGVITIKLSDRIHHNDAKHNSVPEVVMLGGIVECEISYKEFVSIFREMGYVMQYICYESCAGLLNYDDEFSNFVPMIMEYIAWNRNTIEHLLKISGTDDLYIVADNIEFINSIDQLYALELRCINAKFDHLLHNSIPFIELLQKASDEKQMEQLILELYQTTHREIMEPVKSMFHIIPNDIDPIAIAQQVNNTHGLLYSNIMNEIFAYCAYWLICFKGCLTFREEVLTDGTTSFKELVRNFIKKADINCFDLYIRDVVRSNPLEDYVSEDANYFEANDSDDSDDYEDQSIVIVRNAMV